MLHQDQAETVAPRLDDTHLSLLRVCLDYPHKDNKGSFAGEWIKNECERRGVPFHQAWLTKLVNEGLLVKDDLTRGGKRRYYRITDAELARRVLSLTAAGI
jgi:hypothetical protein